jgi:hypothetical protein
MIHSPLSPSPSSSMFLLMFADVLELIPILLEVLLSHEPSSSPNRTSKPSSLTIWNGKGRPSTFLLGGFWYLLLRERFDWEFADEPFANMEGKSCEKSGLQPGRQPQMMPMEVSMQMMTKRTVPCPVKTALVGDVKWRYVARRVY